MPDLDARLGEAARALADAGPTSDLWVDALDRSRFVGGLRDVATGPDLGRWSRRAAIGAVAACLVGGLLVILVSGDPEPSTDLATGAIDDAQRIVAEEVEVAVWSADPRPSLSIDGIVQGELASGTFQMDTVVVELECAAARIPSGNILDGRDIVLGGRVRINEDQRPTLDDVDVTEGAYVALIIREAMPSGQRVTLFEPGIWTDGAPPASSCTELVDAVPQNLDGGYFSDVVGPITIE